MMDEVAVERFGAFRIAIVELQLGQSSKPPEVPGSARVEELQVLPGIGQPAAAPFEVGQAVEIAAGRDVVSGVAQVVQGLIAMAAKCCEARVVEPDRRIARQSGGKTGEGGLGLPAVSPFDRRPELEGERAGVAGGQRCRLLRKGLGTLQIARLAGRVEESEAEVGRR